MTRVLAATLCLAAFLAVLATETGRVVGGAEGRALELREQTWFGLAL